MLIAPFVADRLLDGTNTALACECLHCGLLWLNINPSHEQLERYYQDYWEEPYIQHREQYEPGLRERHAHLLIPRGYNSNTESFIRPHLNGHRILDYGGGTGIEAPFRNEFPIDVFDLATKPAAEGCTAITTPQPIYDLVVIAHVLEHATHPRDLLHHAAAQCNPTGHIYIEVPNEALLYGNRPRLSTVTQVRHFWHEHLQYFDATSLTALITNTDLMLIDLQEDTWAGGGLIRVIAKGQ